MGNYTRNENAITGMQDNSRNVQKKIIRPLR